VEAHEKEEEKKEPLYEQDDEVVVYADEGDMLKLKPILNIQKCTLHPTSRPKLLHPQWNKQRMCPSHKKWWN